MSLAASGGLGGAGGGAGGGGLAMAHQANAVGQGAMPPQQPKAQKLHGVHGTGAPPPSSAALGADLLDKQQSITLKQVRNLSHLPIVGLDLHAAEPCLAFFPPRPDDTAEGLPPILVGKMKPNVWLKATEASHKTLRKYLTGSKTYASLRSDCIATPTDKKVSTVTLERPQRWLGVRRLEDVPAFFRDQVTTESSSGAQHAISEEGTPGAAGLTFANSTLDGSHQPQGDDFDRVVCKVRLHASKKALTVLPEEALQILINQARYYVAAKIGTDTSTTADTEDEILDYPCAVALPAWACHDAAIESLYDATGSSAVFFQRSICALAGALLPGVEGKSNQLLERLNNVRAVMHKEFQRQQAMDPDATFDDDIMLLLFGMTEDGFECTAVQVSALQPKNISCLFGNFKVVSSVSCPSADPLSKMDSCTAQLEAAIDTIAPEADGPAAILSYGSPAEQEKIRNQWGSIKSKQPEWKQVPIISTKSDCVSTGAAVLGGVSHGRLSTLVQKGEKTKAELGIRVQNVAPVAVGVQISYHGGGKMEPVKAIFDFDRRIPAGPYALEFKASECVLYRAGKVADMSDEDFIKAVKVNEGSKMIPEREVAALDLTVQIVQKWSRDDDWTKVGDPIAPLVKLDKDEKREACECMVLELSLGVNGMITTALIGDRQSVVQATKSARNSMIRYYLGILAAVLFFGGFLVRSYWEDYVFKRDYKRILAYYKHQIPGSINDGDVMSAQRLAYKHRHNKKKLWKALEKKYGEPVLQTWEYEKMEAEKAAAEPDKDDEGEEIDLDEKAGMDEEPTAEPNNEEPDL